MAAGRTPVLGFHELKIGQSVELKGKRKRFVYQYVHQFNKSSARQTDNKRLGHKREDDRVYVVRES